MEILKDIFVDWLLFSLIEGYIFCLFFEKLGGLEKFKWYDVLIISIGNCIISMSISPIIYQIACCLFMGYYLIKKLNIYDSKYIKLSAYSIFYVCTIEVLGVILYNFIFDLEYIDCDKFQMFLLNIPIKLFEIIILKILEGIINENFNWFRHITLSKKN